MRTLADDAERIVWSGDSRFHPDHHSFSNFDVFLIHLSFPSTQIDNLLRSSKIPIVVGGTNYYIESILWQNLVSPGIGKRKTANFDGDSLIGLEREAIEFLGDPSMLDKMNDMESTKLFEYLKLIDPTMANRLHPNNKRKIMRWVAGRSKFAFRHIARTFSGVNNLVEHEIRACQAFVERHDGGVEKLHAANPSRCVRTWILIRLLLGSNFSLRAASQNKRGKTLSCFLFFFSSPFRLFLLGEEEEEEDETRHRRAQIFPPTRFHYFHCFYFLYGLKIFEISCEVFIAAADTLSWNLHDRVGARRLIGFGEFMAL